MRVTTITFEALDDSGMTLGELYDRLSTMLSEGVPSSEIVRVRTRMVANQHGSPVKRITVVENS